jgi:trehalose 6-phosphate synthase
MDAVAQSLGGTWVAHGSGDADREASDEHGRVMVPPDKKSYRLKRIWLTEEDHALYYSGASNGALWPLCHIAYVRPRFRLEEWERYREVNRRFAESVLEEIGDQPAMVFLQDYHLALAAKTLKERRPDLQVAIFWHIPWPNAEVFRIFPWREELLEGLLANDFIGFHIRGHGLNFLHSVGGTLEARVDFEQLAIDRGGRRTWVRAFPISVPADEIGALAGHPDAEAAEARIRRELNLEGLQVGLGIDRLDYTKGIPERFEALERFYELHPEWVDRFAFIQIGVPSRIELEEYRSVQIRTRELVQRINERFPGPRGRTVHLIEDNMDFRQLVPFYRMADVCSVTSLHDGMNLVAKEYIAASPDLEGALILSPFTGAAREMERAFIASPYDREGTAAAFFAALTEPEEARSERMSALREIVLRRNIYDWAIDVLDSIQRLTLSTPTPEIATGDPGAQAKEVAS